MRNSQSKLVPKWVLRRAPATILGVLVLAVCCSILYDLLVKPGISAGGRILLGVMTLGSQAARDSVYASASLDPRPITPLLLLALGIACLASAMLVPPILWSSIEPVDSADEGETNGDAVRGTNWLGRLLVKLGRQRRAFFVFAGLNILVGMVAFSVHTQAVAVWREFHADIAIVRPFISDSEYNLMLSRYARMTTKQEYVGIHADLARIAESQGVSLRNVQSW